MFPNNRRSLTRLGIVLFAIAVAQFSFTSSSFAEPGSLYSTDLATGSIIAYAPDGTPTTFATGLVSPQGIIFVEATDSLPGYFYVADAGNGGATSGVVYRFDRAGNRTTFFTGLNNPKGVARDGGDILVAENGAGRIRSIPVDGSAAIISQIVATPMGIDAHAFDQNGFRTKFIANGDSVFSAGPGQPLVDIDPADVSRSVGVNSADGKVYVTTAAGTVSKLNPDGTLKTQFASGLTDLHGLAFVPAGTIAPPGVYVAQTSAGIITRILSNGTKVTFVSGAGNPNYITFENFSPADPTPTPTPSPTVTPTVTPTPTPTPTPPDRAQNLSTRVDVETGANVGIGGFIITGTEPKLVVVRALGPSLEKFGVPGFLADPVLELHDSNQDIIATNDNWMDNSPADQQLLTDHLLNPSEDLESAIIITLEPGTYTGVVSGKNGGTGVALIEIYDLSDPSVGGELGNLSTRGLVGTDVNVLIGGIIVGPEGGADAATVVRAIGPSLADFGVTNPLADPVLELRNVNGDLIAMNDNWETDLPPDNYSAEVMAAGLAPTDPSESAIFANLTFGNYTAIVTGKNETTGVGLVEVYHVEAQTAKNSGP